MKFYEKTRHHMTLPFLELDCKTHLNFAFTFRRTVHFHLSVKIHIFLLKRKNVLYHEEERISHDAILYRINKDHILI